MVLAKGARISGVFRLLDRIRLTSDLLGCDTHRYLATAHSTRNPLYTMLVALRCSYPPHPLMAVGNVVYVEGTLYPGTHQFTTNVDVDKMSTCILGAWDLLSDDVLIHISGRVYKKTLSCLLVDVGTTVDSADVIG